MQIIADNQACNFIKKEALAQVFSCKFHEFSKKSFFYRKPTETASEYMTFFKIGDIGRGYGN